MGFSSEELRQILMNHIFGVKGRIVRLNKIYGQNIFSRQFHHFPPGIKLSLWTGIKIIIESNKM